MKELHHKKPRRPVTLEEFLRSWFHVKTAQVNLEASCFNTAKEGAKGENIPMEVPSPFKKFAETLGEEAHVCDTKITFINNNLLLGEALHNRPLYMVRQILRNKINRILIDEGSRVNILPIRMMKELGIATNELDESSLMIQGFNQGRVVGSIKLGIHVIDAKTLYNILLGRP